MSNRPTDDGASVRWGDLEPDRQLALRIEYGRYLDTLPQTCSLEEKQRRFAHWLAERNIVYPA